MESTVRYVGGPMSQRSGPDIGAEINAAYVSLPPQGGTIVVLADPSKCYDFITPIVVATPGKYLLLESGGLPSQIAHAPSAACLNYLPTNATSAITLGYTPLGGSTDLRTYGVRNLTLTNNRCQTMGGCGSDAVGVSVVAANGASFDGLRVLGFGTGISVTSSSSGSLLISNCTVSENGVGFFHSHAEGPYVSIDGCQFQGNGTGVSSAASLRVSDSSIVSSTVVGIACSSPAACDLSNDHFENGETDTTHFISGNGVFSVLGGDMRDESRGGVTDWWIHFAGAGFLIAGTALSTAGRTAEHVLLNDASGIAEFENNSGGLLRSIFSDNTRIVELRATNGSSPVALKVGLVNTSVANAQPPLTGSEGFKAPQSEPQAFMEPQTLTAESRQVANLNGITYIDGLTFPFSTKGIRAAIAAVIARGGGVVDASGVSNLTISEEIDVGNHSQVPVTLRLPISAVWTVTIRDGKSCAIKQFGNSSIIGPAMGGSSRMVIRAAPDANLNSLYCTEANPMSGFGYIRAEGFLLYNPNGATLASAAMSVRYTADDSVWRDITIASYSGIGLLVSGACCGASFQNITSNSNYGAGGAGALPVKILFQNVTGLNPTAVGFYNISADHPGPGLPSIQITSVGGGLSRLNSPTLEFYNLYIEGSATDRKTALVEIAGGLRLGFHGVTVTRMAANSAAPAFQLSNSHGVPTLFQLYGFSFYNDNGGRTYTSGGEVVDDRINQRMVYADFSGNLSAYDTGTLRFEKLVIGGGKALATSTQSGTGSICMTTGCELTTPVIDGPSSGTGVQGHGSKLLTSNDAFGTSGTPLCIDAGGSATTSGCGMHRMQVTSLSPSCATGHHSYDACANVLRWPRAFPDSNYSVTCSGIGPSNPRANITIAGRSSESVTVNVVTYGSIGVSFSELDCTGVYQETSDGSASRVATSNSPNSLPPVTVPGGRPQRPKD